MKLYHGTSATHKNNILKYGLQPRYEKTGNWKEYTSISDCVYLTNAYAPYFAVTGSKNNEDILIVEIDTDYLEEDLFYPDEDFLTQYIIIDELENLSFKEKHLWFSEHITYFSDYYKLSLNKLGNCSYFDEINSEAITKITQVNIKEIPHLITLALNPSIHILNYMIMGEVYRNLTKGFARYSVNPESFYLPTELNYHYSKNPEKIKTSLDILNDELKKIEVVYNKI